MDTESVEHDDVPLWYLTHRTRSQMKSTKTFDLQTLAPRSYQPKTIITLRYTPVIEKDRKKPRTCVFPETEEE